MCVYIYCISINLSKIDFPALCLAQGKNISWILSWELYHSCGKASVINHAQVHEKWLGLIP